MKKNPIETVLGFGVLILTVIFLFFAAGRVASKNIDGYTLSATFLKIGGLEVGSDVRISGIKVGTVTTTELNPDDYTARVSFTIAPSIRIPEDTIVSIYDSGLMGNKYIHLTPGKSSRFLQAGDELKQTQNYKSLEDTVSEFIFLSMK